MKKFVLRAESRMEEFPVTWLNGKPFGVFDPMLKTDRSGVFHLKFPDSLIESLPGSFAEGDDRILYGDHISNGRPIVTQKKKSVEIRIFHGSGNSHAVRLSELASSSLSDPKTRGEYQRMVYELVKPILSQPFAGRFHLQEDCIATGDSIIGLIEYARLKFPEVLLGPLRIDVLCATVQGLAVITRYFQEADISVELNVGYLAYGLSQGVIHPGQSVPIHANYIVYPAELMNFFPSHVQTRILKLDYSDKNRYVVGDMGDAFKSLPSGLDGIYPWNLFRNDSHGDRNPDSPVLLHWLPGKPMNVYMANGGYFMRSLHRMMDPSKTQGEWIISAKRVWSPDPKFGYGVLMKE